MPTPDHSSALSGWRTGSNGYGGDAHNCKFAPVAPPHIHIQMLERCEPRVFGSYHLWLAHLAVERAEQHKEVIRLWNHSRSRSFKPLTVIMDNSIVELGASLNADFMKQAIEAITPSSFPDPYESTRLDVIPVLPDVMGDGAATRISVLETYSEWVAKVPAPKGFMAVLQGNSWQDFCLTADTLLLPWEPDKFKKITWVGIPRVLTKKVGSRIDAVEYVRTIAPHVKIHLLGFSDDMWDDVKAAKMPGVQGIDSAVPVRHNSPLTPMSKVAPRFPNWMDVGELTSQNVQNICAVRKWINQREL